MSKTTLIKNASWVIGWEKDKNGKDKSSSKDGKGKSGKFDKSQQKYANHQVEEAALKN